MVVSIVEIGDTLLHSQNFKDVHIYKIMKMQYQHIHKNIQSELRKIIEIVGQEIYNIIKENEKEDIAA